MTKKYLVVLLAVFVLKFLNLKFFFLFIADKTFYIVSAFQFKEIYEAFKKSCRVMTDKIFLRFFFCPECLS